MEKYHATKIHDLKTDCDTDLILEDWINMFQIQLYSDQRNVNTERRKRK